MSSNILRGQLNGRSNAIDCKSFSGISAGNAIFGVEVCRGDNIGCIVVVFIRSTCDYLSPGNGNLLPGGGSASSSALTVLPPIVREGSPIL